MPSAPILVSGAVSLNVCQRLPHTKQLVTSARTSNFFIYIYINQKYFQLINILIKSGLHQNPIFKQPHNSNNFHIKFQYQPINNHKNSQLELWRSQIQQSQFLQFKKQPPPNNIKQNHFHNKANTLPVNTFTSLLLMPQGKHCG